MFKTLLVALAAVSLLRYECVNPRVIDGDTVRCDLQLGLGFALMNESIRLVGVDTPELSKTPEPAKKAKARLQELVDQGDVWVLVHPKEGRDKYGRVLGIVMVGGVNANSTLIEEGLGREYHGGKR